jgi:hypothetical protein
MLVHVTPPSDDLCHWYRYPDEVLGQVPDDEVKVCPVVLVPVIAGTTVACGGTNPLITADVTVAVSTVFTPPTLTRI